jgi:hypothetical protein
MSEHDDRHSPRPAWAQTAQKQHAGVAQAGRATKSAARIRLPEGAARKVSASVRRACIPGHLRGIGPEPGTWKDPSLAPRIGRRRVRSGKSEQVISATEMQPRR